MMSSLLEKTILPGFFLTVSDKTASKYKNIINDFMRFTGRSFEKCTNLDARAYDSHLADLTKSKDGLLPQLSASTHASRISVLRSLSSFIEKCNFVDGYVNIFSNVVVAAVGFDVDKESLVPLLDLELLFEAAADDTQALLIFSLVAKCGLSTSQICNLRISDVCIDENSIVCGLKLSKGGYSHNIFITKDVLALLIKHVGGQRFNSATPLFLNKRGQPLTERTLQRILTSYLSQIDSRLSAGWFTLQQMRHSAITYMKLGGASDADIADYLGLVRPSTVSRYTKVSNDDLHKAVTFSVLSVNK